MPAVGSSPPSPCTYRLPLSVTDADREDEYIYGERTQCQALIPPYLEDYGLLLCSTYRQGAANSTGHSEQSCEWRVGPAYLNLCPRFQNGIISTEGQLN